MPTSFGRPPSRVAVRRDRIRRASAGDQFTYELSKRVH
jgi:hypothetical protein